MKQKHYVCLNVGQCFSLGVLVHFVLFSASRTQGALLHRQKCLSFVKMSARRRCCYSSAGVIFKRLFCSLCHLWRRFCAFLYFLKQRHVENGSRFHGGVAFVKVSPACRITEARREAGGEKKLFLFSSLPLPPSAPVRPMHKHFGKAAPSVCVCMHNFACVCGVCMKDWCWPKYLPSCIRPGTHWGRERGGEKEGGRVEWEGADATDRDAYQ